MALTLTTDERAELERRVRSLKIRAEDARSARVILMLADGESYSTIEATVPCYRDYINRWRRRFLADRLAGLRVRYRGQPPTVLTPAMEARVLAKTQEPPPDGSTHWSTRKLGRVLKIPPQPGREGVAPGGPPAPSVRALHAVGRSGFRAQGGRRDRPLRQSAGPRAVFAVMRKQRFRPSTASIPPNAMASSTTGTARCRSLPR